MRQVVTATSIAERAQKGERIDVAATTITGKLELSHGNFPQPISLHDCDLEELDLSYSRFVDVVRIRNCRVSGMVELRSATFESELSLTATKFDRHVSLANIDAGRGIDADRVALGKGLDAKNARVARYLLLEHATVGGPISLLRARVDGYVDISQSTFEADATFQQLVTTADLLALAATFCETADFRSAKIGGRGVFLGSKWADKALFEGVVVGDDLVFERASFASSFSGAALSVKGDLNCKGVPFGSMCDLQASQIDGDVLFDGATFVGEAKFVGLATKGQAQFVGAHFVGKAWFDMACLDQGFYGERLKCDDEFSFTLVAVGMDLDISNATFAKASAFNRSSTKSNLFAISATFGGDADFLDVSVGTEAKFIGCTFTHPGSTWDLRWASFNVLHVDGELGDSPPKNAPYRLHETNVQLSGCRYNRLYAYWLPLLEAHTSGADLQPYTQLESVLQGQGFDDMAARVYFCGHKEVGDAILHGKDKIGFLKHWLIRVPLDLLWRFVGYGVNSKRLFWPVALFLVLGFFAFSQPSSTCVTANGSCKINAAAPAWPEASWLTLRTFLPVDIPALGDLKPSHAVIKPWGISLPADYYASLLRIAGWITVPVLIAALAGFLRRSRS